MAVILKPTYSIKKNTMCLLKHRQDNLLFEMKYNAEGATYGAMQGDSAGVRPESLGKTPKPHERFKGELPS